MLPPTEDTELGMSETSVLGSLFQGSLGFDALQFTQLSLRLVLALCIGSSVQMRAFISGML